MKSAIGLAFLVATGVGVVSLLFSSKEAHAAAPAKPIPTPDAPPWIIPGLPASAAPHQIFSAQTGVTPFPVDVWQFPSGFYVVVATNDYSSWVAYDTNVTAPPAKVAAQGTGPLTAQILTQGWKLAPVMI